MNTEKQPHRAIFFVIVAAVALTISCHVSARDLAIVIDPPMRVIPVHGEPFLIKEISEISGDDIIFYVTDTGQESFIARANIANQDDISATLKSMKPVRIEGDKGHVANVAQAEQTAPSGEFSIDLGHKDLSFGSASQASAILDLMSRQPGKLKYQITFKTPDDIVIFGADIGQNTVARLHQRPDGHGTAERWIGHSIHRLKAAASGGSLNDIPGGKSPGSMQRY